MDALSGTSSCEKAQSTGKDIDMNCERGLALARGSSFVGR